MDHGSCLTNPQFIFASFKLNIKSIISKLKQKYSANNEENHEVNEFIKLDYLTELDEVFVLLQTRYNFFLKKFY